MSSGGPYPLVSAVATAQVQASLRRFITLDQGTCLAAVGAIMGVHLLVDPNGYLVLLAAMVALAAALMGLGRRPLAAGNLRAAVLWVAVANWTVSLAATAVAPFCLPITVVAAMLPSILAVPYLEVVALWRISAASMVVATLVTAVGTLQDFSGLSRELEPWLPPVVILFFVPFITGLVVLVSAHNGARLRRVLADALEANRRLRASERELVESRTRLVAATDQERRRIAQDLHDGAQQRLLSVMLGLQRARRLLESDRGAADGVIQSLAGEVRASIAELRDLAYGLYPPVLTDRGLGEALAEMVERVPGCRLEMSWLPRFAPEVEAAVYWCCAEAVQNFAKHAGTGASLRLRVAGDRDGALAFDVEDDGVGFDPSRVERGQGLTNLADRVGAANGEINVWSAPGHGVRIHAVLPVASRAQAVSASSPPRP